MPTRTFYNLPDGKRQMIEAALLTSFYDQHISEVTVAQIVETAKISRAAFYKYFPTLEDAHTYMVSKISVQIHQDILSQIEEKRQDFFGGIREYLRYCSKLSHDGEYWKGLKLLIKGEKTLMSRRMDVPEETRMVKDWLELLRSNGFNIKETEEAMSFLYFVMDLVIDSLTSLIVNNWRTEELLNDFAYKTKWLIQGIK